MTVDARVLIFLLLLATPAHAYVSDHGEPSPYPDFSNFQRQDDTVKPPVEQEKWDGARQPEQEPREEKEDRGMNLGFGQDDTSENLYRYR